MTAPADLEKYLSQRYGATGIIVRDQAQGAGLREWSEKDTQALCQWLDGQSKAGRRQSMSLRASRRDHQGVVRR